LKKNIYIRVDGNSEIGLGHLFRCLALSQMLNEDFNIHFVSKEIPANFITLLSENNVKIIVIKSENEIFNFILKGDIVVIDSYSLDSNYHDSIKDKECVIVCIDDIHDKTFNCDLIINHSEGISPINYKTKKSRPIFALGLDYVLLRKSFLEIDNNTNNKTDITICFGGSDPKNLTKSVLEILLMKNVKEIINVIVGSANNHYNQLLKEFNSNELINFLYDISEKEVIKTFNRSKFAIVPCSGILLEAIACGTIPISGYYIENQKNIYKNLLRKKAFIDVNNFELKNISSAIDKFNKEDYDINQIIDLKSDKRLKKLFSTLNKVNDLKLEIISTNDIEVTYHWANNSIIRAFSFNKSHIEFEDHKRWITNKIDNLNCSYYIAVYKDSKIGSIRFDIEKENATISYLLDPKFHGQGFGILILKKGLENFIRKIKERKIKQIIGLVEKNNVASVNAFKKLGFKFTIDGELYKFYLDYEN